MPYFPHPVNAVARPLLGLARGARALLTGTLERADQESWPEWDDLVRTPLMHAEVRRAPPRRFAAADALRRRTIRQARAWPGGRACSQLAALQLAYLTRG